MHRRRITRDCTTEAKLTANQAAAIQVRRQTLRKQITRLRPLQTVYMPGVGLRIERQMVDGVPVPAEKVLLWLPSALTRAEREEVCQPGLAVMEEKLREGQCFDTLNKIRAALRAKTHFIQHKNANVRSQRRTTRALNLIDGFTSRINSSFLKYNTARAALLALRGPGDWENTLRVLLKEDLKAPSGLEFGIEDATSGIGADGRPLAKRHLERQKRALGEGYRVISWIWLSGVTEVAEGESRDATDLNNGTFIYIVHHSVSILIH